MRTLRRECITRQRIFVPIRKYNGFRYFMHGHQIICPHNKIHKIVFCGPTPQFLNLSTNEMSYLPTCAKCSLLRERDRKYIDALCDTVEYDKYMGYI